MIITDNNSQPAEESVTLLVGAPRTSRGSHILPLSMDLCRQIPSIARMKLIESLQGRKGHR